MERDIPFDDQFKEALLEGRKVATARYKKYAERGDHFRQFGQKFRVIAVLRIPLRALWPLYQLEGVGSEEELKALWWSLHPRRRRNEDARIWVYIFQREPPLVADV